MKASVRLNTQNRISKVDDRLFGSFIEHLGRAVYGGIWEPGHPRADGEGFRQDVIDLVKQLRVPVVRYPGGNFVSGYKWEDGTGDRSKRPRRMELAWNSIETNQVGIDEFRSWAKKADTEVMMAVNLGTRGPAEARDLLEYCNGTTDTYHANLRRQNGFEQPFGIKLWCLGNEMDGPWQMGHKTAYEYGRTACETGKLMKWTDPSIELVACGSSFIGMPTFGEWERTVLRECYDQIDYISLHSYYGNQNNDTADFFSRALEMDTFIKTVAGICDEIKAEKHHPKTINLSFDEWNVWFHSHGTQVEPWSIAPPILEDVYTLEDAVLVGSLLITLLNNCDRVKIACLAQLVNVIAPIMTENTENGGRAWAQTIFWPFCLTSNNGRGTALSVTTACGTYDAASRKNVPFVDAAAVLSEDGETVNLFVVNRSLDEACSLDVELDGFRAESQLSIEGDDLKAVNTADKPDTVVPVEKNVGNGITLAPHSWSCIRLTRIRG